MGFFDINFDSLRTQLLPVRLRKPRMKAWMRALLSPITFLHYRFRSNRDANLYIVAHNSQVVYLQAALNDTFDPVGRGILIEDGPYEDPLFVYLPPELSPLWLGLESEAGSMPFATPATLFTVGETSLMGYAFIVKVPASISFDIGRMKALIDKYRVAGRNIYQVTTY
jgi:hypothetical protein